MIDTDKYEGHTEGMWIVEGGSVYLQDEVTPIARMDRDTNHTTPTERDSNARLIADAPLLLEEVKRLRKIEQEHGRVTIDDWEHKPLGDVDAYPLPYVTVYHGGCEYVGLLRLYKNEDGEVIE